MEYRPWVGCNMWSIIYFVIISLTWKKPHHQILSAQESSMVLSQFLSWWQEPQIKVRSFSLGAITQFNIISQPSNYTPSVLICLSYFPFNFVKKNASSLFWQLLSSNFPHDMLKTTWLKEILVHLTYLQFKTTKFKSLVYFHKISCQFKTRQINWNGGVLLLCKLWSNRSQSTRGTEKEKKLKQQWEGEALWTPTTQNRRKEFGCNVMMINNS